MELKHFSHSHGLAFHQVPQGSQIQCAACKSPGSGNVYACWQCSYFLHDHCFRATRSLKHPSHPLHPLTLVPSPTYPSGSFFCNSCTLAGDGLSYSCSECEFDIHVHCAIIPNPIPHNYNSQVPQTPIYPTHIATSPNDPPQTSINNPFAPNIPVYPQPQPTPVQSSNPKSETSVTQHFSHPHFLKPIEIKKKKKKKLDCSACESNLSGSAYSCTEPHCSFNLHKACFDSPRQVHHKFHPHPLTLLASSAPIEYTCDACQKGGKAFVYNCATCSYDLHIDCFRSPETVSRPDHDHPLSLSAPAAESIMCDVCKNTVNEKAWFYNCSECDFGTHLECVHSEMSGEEEAEETGDITDQLFKMQQQQTHNMFRLQMAQQNAQFMNSLANSWRFY